MGVLNTVDPAIKETIAILEISGEQAMAVDLYKGFVIKGERAKAEDYLRTRILPSLTKNTYDKVMNAGGGSKWASAEDCINTGLCIPKQKRPLDCMHLGLIPLGDEGKKADILFHGDGHLLTVAPTGAGKGQSLILSNAMHYHGPMVCFDPKGEIYDATAWYRSWKGKVYKFAPFGKSKKDEKGNKVPDSDCFNPLDFVSEWEDVDQLAELMVLPSSGDDAFWDGTAQDLIADLIMFVKKTKPPELQNMREVCRLISSGSKEFDDMMDDMKSSGFERLLEQANRLEQMSDKLRSSMLAVAHSHTKVWRHEKIVSVTSKTTEGFAPGLMASEAALEETVAEKGFGHLGPQMTEDGFVRGKAASVFIVFPPDKIDMSKAIIRVILGIFMNELIKYGTDYEGSKPKRPFLFMIDEMAQLGRMKVLERAVSIVRGYNIRLWMFIQDLSQLKNTYNGWEKFFGNTKTQVYFSPNDLGTAEYISRQLGRKRDVLGSDRELASPQELMGQEFKGQAVIKVSGVNPIRAQLYPRFFEDPEEQEFIDQQKIGDYGIPHRDRGSGN